MNLDSQTTHRLAQKVFARQFGQHTQDTVYRDAMDTGRLDLAEDLVERHPNPWTRMTRLSFIRSRQGKLGEAITLVNAAENEVSTRDERARHLANLAHYSIMLGDLREAMDFGVKAVLLDPIAGVAGAVNAGCAASLLRSRRDLALVLRLLGDKTPQVLADPHWRERWLNDPQLAFGRDALSFPAILH